MSNYHRATSECALAQLRPPLRQAIRDYVVQHGLGEIEDLLMCCETISEKKDTGWLTALLTGEPDSRYNTALLLTRNSSSGRVTGDRSGTVVSAAKLKDIQVRAYSSVLTGDWGLEVSGFVEGFPRRLRGFIALGPELAAQQFCDVATQAVSKAQPPPAPRTFFGIPWNRP